MLKNNLRTWMLMSLTLGLCLAAFSSAWAAPPPVNDEIAIRYDDGSELGGVVWKNLDRSDNVTLNGHVYIKGPAYSPKKTCGKCHDYDTITRAYHFREGAGPNGENLSDHWVDREKDGSLYRYLANAYSHLLSPGQYGAW